MAIPSQFLKLRGSSVGEPAARTQDNISNTLTPIAQALSRTPIVGAAPTWTLPDLDPAFSASTTSPPGYYKDSLMRVQTKGRASTAAGVAANATLMTFPMGLRPKESQSLTVRGNGATYQSITVAPTGVVTVDVAIGAGGTVDFGFSFLAEQ